MKLGNILGGLGGGLLLGAMGNKQGMGFGQMLQGLFNPLGILGNWGGGKHPLIGGEPDPVATQALTTPAEAVPGALDPSIYLQNVLGQIGGLR